jgi:hypothetical protein
MAGAPKADIKPDEEAPKKETPKKSSGSKSKAKPQQKTRAELMETAKELGRQFMLNCQNEGVASSRTEAKQLLSGTIMDAAGASGKNTSNASDDELKSVIAILSIPFAEIVETYIAQGDSAEEDEDGDDW